MKIQIEFRQLVKIIKNTLKERTSENEDGEMELDDDIKDLAEIIAVKVRDAE